MKDLLKKIESKESPIGIVGLGYVGLPLACLLANKFKVIGFDINETRVGQLRKGVDVTNEVEESSKLLNPNLTYTSNADDIANCKLFIVAVPTPVDGFKVPDLRPLLAASTTVGKVMTEGSIVCFESTVYPGVTENSCGPQLEKISGLKQGSQFYLGYSPERVNPGDKDRSIEKIVKVVSGETDPVADLLCSVYEAVIEAGIFRAKTIKTAEASKVIENVQRDINIAIVNELAMLFDNLGIDTIDVLEAAGSKWNFIPMRPGLVGGHCIGVDPYYLNHQASGLGFNPEVLSAARRVNDRVGSFIAQKTLNLITESGKGFQEKRPVIGILGVTFKENVPDIRNTKVIDMAESLEKIGAIVHICDPIADVDELKHEYKRELVSMEDMPVCDAMIVAVKHKQFVDAGLEYIEPKLGPAKVLVDVKSTFDRSEAAERGMLLWRL